MPDLIGALSDKEEWYTKLNWSFTVFSIGKAFADTVLGTRPTYSGVISPIAETVLNVC